MCPGLPLNELLEETDGTVPQRLLVFGDGVMLIGKFLLQFLQLFELLTNLLQTLCDYGEPGQVQDTGI